MDVLREREVKDSLERQLSEEQKLRGECHACYFIVMRIDQLIDNREFINRYKSLFLSRAAAAAVNQFFPSETTMKNL